MARQSKAVEVLKYEKKSHKTKAEIAFRTEAEQAVLTGQPIHESDEVRANISAHKAFERLIPRMEQIGKNDELYGEASRRYCMNIAEYERLNVVIEKLESNAEAITDPTDYNKAQADILKQKQFAFKVQDMLNKFESDNGMNVSASLRIIPKKPEQVHDQLEDTLLRRKSV